MLIAVISDSHDRINIVEQVLTDCADCEVLVHCGDFCAPFMMEVLAKFNGEVHCVFGNTDDRHKTTLQAQKHGIHLHGDIGVFKLDGVHFACNHFPEIARALAFSNQFDVVCFGHTHKAHQEVIGSTLLLNPGELMGRFGSRSYAVYDTETRSVSFRDVK